MKKYFLLLTLIVSFILLIPCTVNADSKDASLGDDLLTFFIQKSITVTELADELAESDYPKLMGSTEILSTISEIGDHEFSTPDGAIIIQAQDQLYDVLFKEIGLDKLSGFPKEQLKASLPNLLGNILASRNGVKSISASSIISLMQTYDRPEDMQNSILVILAYDWGEDSYCSCVSFTINNVDFINVSPRIIKCDAELVKSMDSQSVLNDWLFTEYYIDDFEDKYEDMVSIYFVSSTEIADILK